MQPVTTDPQVVGPLMSDPGWYLAWMVYRCPGCGSLNLAQGATNTDFFYNEQPFEFIAQAWYPQSPLTKVYPDSVPPQIAKAAVEAHGCLSVGHHQAAVAMARTTVEAIAKAKGTTHGKLVEKIDKLYEQKLIYEHVKDAAHQVRFAGNDAAHGDLVDDPISEDETKAILELMDMVLDGVFIAPAKTAAQKAAREEKKAGR
jgi:hypothetical protein